MKITIGNLIDQLTIANIRLWNIEDKKRNPKATNKDLAEATRASNVINTLRNDLIQSIDEQINELILTGKPQKLYKQGSTKSYGK